MCLVLPVLQFCLHSELDNAFGSLVKTKVTKALAGDTSGTVDPHWLCRPSTTQPLKAPRFVSLAPLGTVRNKVLLV